MEIAVKPSTLAAVTCAPLLMLAAACSPDTPAGEVAAEAGSARGAAATQAEPADRKRAATAGQEIVLTDDLLQALARGLAVEAEILRRPGRGTHYGVNAREGTGEGDLVLAAARIPGADYRRVEFAVRRVFTILNAQGKLGPKLISLSMEHATEEQKERFARDPLDELSPESADALRRNMELLAGPWIEVTAMTAQHGQ